MLGKEIHVMTCNGKQLPYRNEFDFDIILFGTMQNAKAQIHVKFNKNKQAWLLEKIDVVSRSHHLKLL